MVFLDAAKAFDKVWHKGLLYKLKQLGIEGDLFTWLSSYLSDRQQRVVIGGSQSPLLPVRSGVPQGSVLGPLLFLVYVNDIAPDICTNISLFADDTSLYDIVNDPALSAERLNCDLVRLYDWSVRWQVNFNASKTEVVTFSNKREAVYHPPLKLGDSVLNEVSQHKHLGIILSSNLSWSPHIHAITTKASKRVGIMRRLKYVLSRQTLVKLYTTLIRPILEYGCIIFDNCTVRDQELLETVQLDSARVCTGSLWNTNEAKLLQELGWVKLSKRRHYHKLVMFYKLKHCLVPQYLQQFPIIPVSSLSSYHLCNPERIRPLRTHTNKYKNSYIPASIIAWNDLPVNLTDSHSVQTFKANLKSYLFNPATPVYYSYGERLASIFHTKLRLGYSSLSFDLFQHGLNTSKRCECGHNQEDTNHYFFHCI